MTIFKVGVSSANDPLVLTGEALFKVSMISLHLQARARLHDPFMDPALADDNSAISRSAVDTKTHLRAMSSYCLQYLIPRTQSVLMQVDTLADAAARLQAPDDLTAALTAMAAELDRCCAILRGNARSAPRGAGVIRLGEQRLWGALAAELHRIEGTDGPIMQGCARIETIAFQLSSGIEDILESTDHLALGMRRALCMALVEVKSRAGSHAIPDAELSRLIGLLPMQHPDIAALIRDLVGEYQGLRGRAPQIIAALAVAIQASAQSTVTKRLEGALHDLDRKLVHLAQGYRSMAKQARRPANQPEIAHRLSFDAGIWRDTASRLVEPMALADETSFATCRPDGMGMDGECWKIPA